MSVSDEMKARLGSGAVLLIADINRGGVFARELAPGQHRWFDPLGATKTALVPTTKLVLPWALGVGNPCKQCKR